MGAGVSAEASGSVDDLVGVVLVAVGCAGEACKLVRGPVGPGASGFGSS